MRSLFIIIGLAFFLFQCTSETPQKEQVDLEINPAAEGFDVANSDAKAIKIADAVMGKMGGRQAWDDTKIIKWNFFGARKLTWNKHSGDVRIDFPESDSNVLITNIFTHEGKIKIDGEELTEPDSLVQHYTEMAESIWINDAYWLFMPFKLKDSKTTLKYLKLDTIIGGSYCHQLQLTFTDIGDTPQNMYLVCVDTASLLVNQWSYFSSSSDSLPRMTTPWGNYEKHGNILLSGDRGERGITEIEVLDSISESVFTAF